MLYSKEKTSIVPFPIHRCRIGVGFTMYQKDAAVIPFRRNNAQKDISPESYKVLGETFGVTTKYGQVWMSLMLDEEKKKYWTRAMLYGYKTRYYEGDLSSIALRMRFEDDVDAEGR